MTRRISTAGRIALGCVALALVVLAMSLPASIEALLRRAPGSPAPVEQGVGAVSANMEERVAMFNGRSLFFVPGAPPPPL